MKYAGQLAVIANDKAKREAPAPEGSCITPGERVGPEPGTWAHTARIMAAGDDSGFDWDAWKDEMKERDC